MMIVAAAAVAAVAAVMLMVLGADAYETVITSLNFSTISASAS